MNRHSIYSFLIISFSLVLLSACVNDAKSESPSLDKEDNPTEDISGVKQTRCGGFPFFANAHNVRIEKLVEGHAGNLCYLIREFDQVAGRSTIKPSHWRYRVECVDDEYSLQHCYIPQGNAPIKDITFDGTGQLIVAQLSPLSDESSGEGSDEDHVEDDFDDRRNGDISVKSGFVPYTLKLLRQNPVSGLTLQEKTLRDIPEDEELLYYDTNYETDEITTEVLQYARYRLDIPLLSDVSDVQLVWRNNQLHMLAGTYGIKYYQFDADLNRIKDINIIPAHNTLWFLSTQIRRIARMAVGENNSVAVSMDLNRERAWYLNAALGRDDQLTKTEVQQLVTLISDDSVERFIVGHPEEVEYIAGAQIRGETLWLATNSLRQKAKAAGGTTEWDAVLMAVDLQSKTLSKYFALHEDQEDIVLDFNLLDNDLLLISGMNGYVQADTRSQVSNGQGFHWVVNEQGQIIDSERVTGVRNTQVLTTSVKQGRIVHAKLFDGPISHTCDYDPERTLCYNKAKIETSALSR